MIGQCKLPLQVRSPSWALLCHLVTNMTAYRTVHPRGMDLAEQVDRLYIRDWDE